MGGGGEQNKNKIGIKKNTHKKNNNVSLVDFLFTPGVVLRPVSFYSF